MDTVSALNSELWDSAVKLLSHDVVLETHTPMTGI